MGREPYIPTVWETVDCPICETDNSKLYHTFGNQLQFTYRYCRTCKNIFQSPRPKYDKDFIEAAYERYFAFNPEYEYSAKELKEFKPEAEEIARFDKSKKHLLDVGSCMGSFLKMAKEIYDEVEGVEISENMADFTAKKLGILVHRIQFEDLEVERKYSCIHLSHVLEHIPNPNEWLQKAFELLEDNGILVVCVPNMFALSRRVKLGMRHLGLRTGKWKESWRTPDHLFEPTISGMKYLFGKHGFRLESYYTYSRKDPISESLLSRIFQRGLKIGSNLRFYLRKVSE